MIAASVPNLISIARLVWSPLLAFAGWDGRPGVFLGVLAAFLVSDFADGFLARLLRRQSRLGAALDTLGDVAMGCAAAIGAWWLWPERLGPELPWLRAAFALLGVSALVSLLRHRRLPAYHTWSAKLATATLGIAALLLFGGFSPWPFRVSLGLLALSAAEEIAVALLLPAWEPNVRTAFHALRLRRRRGGRG